MTTRPRAFNELPEPLAPVRIQVEPRYAMVTAAYLALIFWLSSLPDLSVRESHPLLMALSNLAHAPLFAGLAFCVSKTLSGSPAGWRTRYGLTLAFAAACAVLDEWHQSFVPGRYVSAGDLLLDLAGITGVLVVLRLREGAGQDGRR
jgi:VanZ family protein